MWVICCDSLPLGWMKSWLHSRRGTAPDIHTLQPQREIFSFKELFGESGSVAFMKYQWPQETVFDIKAKVFHSCKRTHPFPPLGQPGLHPNPEASVTFLFHSIVLSEAYEEWDHMNKTHSCQTFNKGWKVNTDDAPKKYNREGLICDLKSGHRWEDIV